MNQRTEIASYRDGRMHLKRQIEHYSARKYYCIGRNKKFLLHLGSTLGFVGGENKVIIKVFHMWYQSKSHEIPHISIPKK